MGTPPQVSGHQIAVGSASPLPAEPGSWHSGREKEALFPGLYISHKRCILGGRRKLCSQVYISHTNVAFWEGEGSFVPRLIYLTQSHCILGGRRKLCSQAYISHTNVAFWEGEGSFVPRLIYLTQSHCMPHIVSSHNRGDTQTNRQMYIHTFNHAYIHRGNTNKQTNLHTYLHVSFPA